MKFLIFIKSLYQYITTQTETTQAVCVYLQIVTALYGIKLYFLKQANILNQKQEPNFKNIMKCHKKPVYHTDSVNLYVYTS
jgi:hypothetical protein